MIPYTSCKQAISSCENSKTFAIAHLYNDEKPMQMHIHDTYELYYSISGGKQFLIDNSFYSIEPGDLFFINQYESHYLTQINQGVHERIVYSIYPSYLTELSTQTTNLDFCFTDRSGDFPHKFHLDKEAQKKFLYLTHKLTTLDGFGCDLLERSAFTELMVFLTANFCQESAHVKEPSVNQYSNQVNEILSYINQHICEPFTIDELSEHFFISSSYLCRIFKAATGTTINKYVIAKRITIAKSLLGDGCSVNDACEHSGFNDYSNFLKAFTKAVGISPKKYAQLNSVLSFS